MSGTLQALRGQCVISFRRRFIGPVFIQPQNVRTLKSSSPPGGTGMRSRSRRTTTGGSHSAPARTLLDKFVKHINYDGALVVRAPFSITVKGSYFDEANNVNIDKNRKMALQYRDSSSSPSVALRSDTGTTLQDIEEACPSSALRQDETDELKKLATLMSTHVAKSLSAELSSSSASSSMGDKKSLGGNPQASPLHVLLYGRSGHRVDTYSVINPLQQHHSYIYLTDASSLEEADSMFDQYHYAAVTDEVVSSPHGLSSTAHISIWQPKICTFTGWQDDYRHLSGKDGEDVGNEFSSALKIFSPRHVIEAPDSALRAVCLVPTAMSKIYLQADLGAHIELDGTLIDDLRKVGVTSEVGNIKVKDVTADEIKLASRLGDITCDGIVDGKITAETFGDGDFFAKGTGIYGNSLVVNTDEGDINLWSECRSDECFLSTKRGHIAARELNCSHSNLVIEEVGNVNANVMGGTVSVTVTNGVVYASVDALEEDSSIAVAKGDVYLTLPPKCNFRIRVSCPTANIAPRLLNAGELSLSKETGFEEFTNVNVNEAVPTLHISVLQGSVNVAVTQSEQENSAAFGYDSVT